MAALVLVVLLALTVSAALTVAEVAIFSLGESRLRTLSDEGFRGHAALVEVRSRPEELLVLLRLAKSGANGLVGVLSGVLAFLWWGWGAVAPAVVAVALVLLIPGQLLPMKLAVGHNVRIALLCAPPLAALLDLLRPLLRILEPLVPPLAEGPLPALTATTEREVRQLAALGHTEGLVGEDERLLLERVFRLDETRAHEIMTPRVDIFAWPDSLMLRRIGPQLHTVPYSRVPVYGETIDDISGVLYIRDAYQALLSGDHDVPLREIAREPLIVPGSLPLTKLLKDFQGRRIHLAVVVDEYGGTDGLVTLEDILEELVGEIVDETDIDEEPIVRVSRHEILAEGDADLREINHFFNASFPLLEHRSLNGYLLDELGRVPESGERLQRQGIEIQVVEASETQVLRARLERTIPASEAAAEAEAEAEAAEEASEPAGSPAAPPGPEREGEGGMEAGVRGGSRGEGAGGDSR